MNINESSGSPYGRIVRKDSISEGSFQKLSIDADSSEKLLERFSSLSPTLYNAISVDQREAAIQRIENGKNIAASLLSLGKEPEPSASNALDLTWFFYACACEENKAPYTRGVLRLDNLSEEESSKLYKFFIDCDEADARTRASSHFNDMKVGKLLGLNFGKNTLPIDPELSTLLCGQLLDNTFILKLEREPLTPKHPVSTFLHLKHWGEHVLKKGGEQKVGGYETRRETDGRQEVRNEFVNVISDWKQIDQEAKKFEKKLEKAYKETFSLTHEKIDVDKEKKLNKRIFQMNTRVEEIKTQSKILKQQLDGLKAQRNFSSKNENIKVDKNLIKLEKQCQELEKQYQILEDHLNKFDGVISTIKNPEKMSGNEILFDPHLFVE